MGIKEEYLSFREDLTNIANAIREKKGIKRKMTMSEMVEILKNDEDVMVLFEKEEESEVDNKIIDIFYGTGISGIEGEFSFEDFPNARSLIPSAFSPNLSSASNPLLTVLKLGTIETIMPSACRNCNGLTHVYAPNVKKIGDNAFYSSQRVKSSLIYLDAPVVEEIGDSAFASFNFDSAPVFDYLNIPNIRKIGLSAFDNAKFEVLDAPLLETVGGNAFQSNSQLKKAIIPKVAEIPSYTFSGCSSLEEVNFLGVKNIGGNALMNTSSLKEIHLPSIEIISESFFYSGVEKIYIENNKKICQITSKITNKTIYVPNHFLKDYKAIGYLSSCTILPLSEVQ